MPKELVHSKYRDKHKDEGHIQLGWASRHVQLATIVPDAKIMLWDEQEQRHVEVVTETPGWFVQLDRSGINQLIRLLRKARDTAYGRDE